MNVHTNRKFVFLDIDGTLFDSKLKIPESAIYAIRTARKLKHKVFICTGRPKPDVDEEIRDVGFDGYIYSCGCLIEAQEQLIYQKTLPFSYLQTLLPILKSSNIGYNLEGIHTSYLDAKAMDLFSSLFMQEQQMNSEMARHYMQSIHMHSINQFILDESHQIVKISIFAEQKEAFHDLQEQLPIDMRLVSHIFGNTKFFNGELSMRDIHKGTGIEHILHHYQCPIEHTIGIGDSMNDLEMIEYCHIGICMENGCDELKARSDEVCPAIDKDGIYHAFQYHGLLD